MSYASSIAYLESLYREPHTVAAEAGLRRASVLLERVGNPHRAFRSVHVAGSTGKGSTTSMVASILSSAGYSVGVFRSPHLVTYRERVVVGKSEISEDAWTWAFSVVQPVVEAMRENRLPGYSMGRPSLFEVLFALACLHFAREGVEWGAIETGLGGRLDATNLVQSDVAAVTNVSLEHTQILGKTVAEIAREKAAIIKEGAHAVTAATGEALAVIRERAREVASPLLVVGEDVTADVSQSASDRQLITFSRGADSVCLALPLLGRHQALNAGVAWGAVLALRERGVAIADHDIRVGMERVRVPGRIEMFAVAPHVILDGAHNPAGMQALTEWLRGLPATPTTLLFAAMEDKDIEMMAALVAPAADRVIVTRVPGTARTSDSQRIVDAFVSLGVDVECVDDPLAAFCIARERTPTEGRVVVAGSMYLVGAIHPLLEGARP